MAYQKNLCRRVTIRLDEKIAVWVNDTARTLGITPSEWVRMVLHSSFVTSQKFEHNVDEAVDRTASNIMNDVVEALSNKVKNEASSGKAVSNDEDNKTHK